MVAVKGNVQPIGTNVTSPHTDAPGRVLQPSRHINYMRKRMSHSACWRWGPSILGSRAGGLIFQTYRGIVGME